MTSECEVEESPLLEAASRKRLVKTKQPGKDLAGAMVICGCETWSLTLRVEHKLRVFENRVLKRIFEPKRDEVTGG
jgi:hypothetical protein